MATPISKFLRNSDFPLKEPVSVFCRIRPLKHDSKISCIKLVPDSPKTLAIITPTDSKNTIKEIRHKFEHVFTSLASQKEVFDQVAFPLLHDLLKGKNALLFSYGVTGSGKSFTLTGEPNNPGIMPRCIDTIFNTIGDFQAPKFTIKPDKSNGFEIQSESEAMQDRLVEVKASLKSLRTTNSKINYFNDGTKISGVNENNSYSVFVSYVEIYNNVVYDLLEDSTRKSMQSKLLREDAQKKMFVNGAIETEVKSAEEAFDIFNAGQRRKRMGNTLLNSESSRSHTIFNIRLVQLEQITPNNHGKSSISNSELLKIAQLSLVDLAGSERTNRSQHTGIRLKEASSVNNSLMSLRTCLDTLRENQQTENNKLVPYRDSRLTLLFKNYFEGDGKVEMIVCLNPSSEDYDENLHVLKFAEMTQEVELIRSENTIRSSPFFNLPEITSLKFDIEKFEEMEPIFEKLSKILRMRQGNYNNSDYDVSQTEMIDQKRLSDIHQDNTITRESEIRSLKITNNESKQNESSNMRDKLLDLQTTSENFVSKNKLQKILRILHEIINQKYLKLNRKILQKDNAELKLTLPTENMSQELNMKLRKQREHLQAVIKAKET